jgi:hypothetical protein
MDRLRAMPRWPPEHRGIVPGPIGLAAHHDHLAARRIVGFGGLELGALDRPAHRRDDAPRGQPAPAAGLRARQGRHGAREAAAPAHAAERPVAMRDVDAVLERELDRAHVGLDHEIATRASALQRLHTFGLGDGGGAGVERPAGHVGGVGDLVELLHRVLLQECGEVEQHDPVAGLRGPVEAIGRAADDPGAAPRDRCAVVELAPSRMDPKAHARGLDGDRRRRRSGESRARVESDGG